MARSVIGALRVTLGLDSAEFETGIKRASKSTQQFTRAAKDVSGSSNLLSSSLRGLGAAIGIASVGAAAQQYLKVADASKQMAAQLRLATQGFGSFSQAQQDVQRIAGITRNGLTETAGLYGNFSRATKELGGQQFEAARATETFAKTLKISGASQSEAAAATTQFGQALASGVLRGDEFNSIMESSPRLARLLADSLGIPIGQLRAMAEQGELTADKLFRALTDRKFTESIDAEFRLMPTTFDEAMGQIYNSAVIAFGAFDRGGQFSTMIANFASDGAADFGNLEAAAESFGVTARQQLNSIVEASKPVIDALAGIRTALAGAQNIIPQAAKISPEGIATGIDSVTGLWRRPQAFGKGVWSALNGGTFRQGFDDFMSSTSAAGLLKQVQGNIDKANTAATMARIWAGNPLADAPRTASTLKPVPASGSKKTSGAKGPSEETLRKRAQREAERAADALRRFTDDVDRENSDLTTTLADLTGTVEARRDADLQHIETERQIRERAINDDDMIDVAKKQQLIELNNQNADARKQLARQRAEEEIRDRQIRADQVRSQLSIELMQYSADAARTARERRAVELRILDAQLAEEESRLRLEAMSGDLEKASEARLRLAQLPALRSAATDRAMRDTQGPLEAYLDRIPKSAEEAREALERVQVDGVDSLIDGLAGVATGARSLGDVFKSVANQIIADIMRINLQRMLVGSGGGGGLLSGLLGSFGAVSSASSIGGVSASSMAYIDGLASQLAVPRNLPGFATGGSFRVGGSSSVGDQQLVAFRANRGEMVDIRKSGNDNGGGGHIAHIVPSPLFDVIIDSRAAKVAAPMSVASGMQARAAAGADASRAARNRIPGR